MAKKKTLTIPDKPDLAAYRALLDEHLEAGCADSKISQAGWLMASELYNILVDHVEAVEMNTQLVAMLSGQLLQLQKNTKPKVTVNKARPVVRKRRQS